MKENWNRPQNPEPDFSKEELEKAIVSYNKRDRRYGMVKEA